jgi:hypothetical protein
MSEPYREGNVLPLTEALRLSAVAAGGLKVNSLLDDQHGRARTDLTTPVEIIDTDAFPSIRVGRPGASQAPAPSDPGVTVSRHRALLISRSTCGWCASG